jgi:integrase/recombinase XerD
MKFFQKIDKKKGPSQRRILRGRFHHFVMEMKIRGFSEQTIDSYLLYNGKFLEFIGKEPRSVTAKDIKSYLGELHIRRMKPRTINMAINSLKCYYESFMGRRIFWNIKRSKVPKDFDPVISKEDVKAMILNTGSLKHRLLIELLYSSGMRVGECVRLKVSDIFPEKKAVFVKCGKGKKDRFTIISDVFLRDMRMYLADKKGDYLFDVGFESHISIRTAEAIVRQAAKRAGIKRRVYPHLLRACFTTHLMERGEPIETLQKLLGHERRETTEGYARLKIRDFSNIRSPLD